MFFIILGIIGFFILFFFDLIALKRIRFLKTIVWLVGNGLIVYSFNMIIRREPRFVMPGSLKYLGIILSIVFSLLLIYSLLIEIPFKKTYLERGAGKRLVTTGTYGLVRHPGVLWLILLLIGFFLFSGSKTLLIAIPVWGLMDTIYIIIQEKFFFIEQFGDAYIKYQEEVPMLIPNRASIKRCISTLIKK